MHRHYAIHIYSIIIINSVAQFQTMFSLVLEIQLFVCALIDPLQDSWSHIGTFHVINN